MADRAKEDFTARLSAVQRDLAGLRVGRPVMLALDRWRSDAAALVFHLGSRGSRRPLIAIFGGTGTGKSTLANRLLGRDLSATSFRGTFTSGAVAITGRAEDVPRDWLQLPRQAWEQAGPARGEAQRLTVVAAESPITSEITLVDTPDLDGDQPAHHAEADRVFRWCEGAIFLVTPEKYQMTELLPYYRLAKRYGLPALFVMNKCEESAVLEDYRRQLADRGWDDATLFAMARDDAGYEPPAITMICPLRYSCFSSDSRSRRRYSAIVYRCFSAVGSISRLYHNPAHGYHP